MATLRSRRFNYRIEKGGLAAGSIFFKDLTLDPETQWQLPFNNIIVRNFSDQQLQVEYGDTVAIISGSEIYLDDKAFGLRSLKITNLTTYENDALIFITVSREITAEAALVAKLTGQNLFDVANGATEDVT